MRELALIIVIFLILAGCVSITSCPSESEEVSDTPASESESESPAATQTEETSTGGSLCEDLPLGFRKTEVARGSWSIPELSEDWGQTEWCYYHTPEALPTMRRHFTNEMPDNGWEQVDWIDAGDTSLSYWTSKSGADGAMIWMIPDEPGTFIAIARSVR